MKTYYLALAQSIPEGGRWQDAKQYEVDFEDRKYFTSFCSQLAVTFSTVVRGSDTKGFDNQGHYFHP